MISLQPKEWSDVGLKEEFINDMAYWLAITVKEIEDEKLKKASEKDE